MGWTPVPEPVSYLRWLSEFRDEDGDEWGSLVRVVTPTHDRGSSRLRKSIFHLHIRRTRRSPWPLAATLWPRTPGPVLLSQE